MKVLVICSLVAAAIASLEPTGYRSPGSSLLSNYLPPSELSAPSAFPSSRYLSANQYTAPQNVIPNSRYLPSVRQSVVPSVLPSTYIPSRQSIFPTLPTTNYLPPNLQTPAPFSPTLSRLSSGSRSQSLSHGVSAPSNIYLPGDHSSGFKQSSLSFGKSYAGTTPFLESPMAKGPISQYLPPNQFGSSASSGYEYNAINDNTPAKYDFEYSVNDEYGNDFGHKERRSGDVTEGVYTVLLPDGRKQIVHYQADQNGFRPRISYEETGLTRSGSIGYGRNANQGYQPEGPY